MTREQVIRIAKATGDYISATDLGEINAVSIWVFDTDFPKCELPNSFNKLIKVLETECVSIDEDMDYSYNFKDFSVDIYFQSLDGDDIF